MLVIESLEESLHQFMTTRVCLLQVGNLLKGIGKIASSSSRDFHLGKYLRILLEYSDVGVREVALASIAAKNPVAPPPIIAICSDCGISYFWFN